MTAVNTIDGVARGMFSFQIQGKWARLDDLMRVALGIPLEFESGVRASYLAETRVRVFKATLKLFGVDETGMFKDPERFNKNGFRRTYYNEFQRFIKGSKRTIGRGIAAMKKAGFLDAYQEVNEDGSLGAWWIRINPLAMLEQLAQLTNKRRSKKGLPVDNLVRPLSSAKQQAEVADATLPSDSAKKGIESPGGDDSDLRGQTPGFSDFAREEILKKETGKVLPKLVDVIPEFNHITPKQLKKLDDLVHHFVPALRCSEDMVKSLTETMEHNPAFLERFSKLGVTDPNDELGAVDTFLKFWPGISRKLWAMRLSRHDQNRYSERCEIDEIRETLFVPADPKKLNIERKQDPGQYWIRCLALALTGKWTATVMAVIAQQARGYLMRRPITYSMIHARFPQIGRVCGINERCHKKLMTEAMTIKMRINVWNAVQEIYGFEYISTPSQRLRDGGPHAYSETHG